jgi:hypothetical protein
MIPHRNQLGRYRTNAAQGAASRAYDHTFMYITYYILFNNTVAIQ